MPVLQRFSLPLTKTCARRNTCVRVDETIIRAHRVRGVQAPENGGTDVSGFPRHRLPIRHESALRSQPFARGDALDHSAPSSIVRLTTASRIGTLYEFFDRGVAPAIAAPAASRARSSVTRFPVRM